METIFSRGITLDEKKRAQENTLDAMEYVRKRKGMWVETHTIVTDSGDVVIVHDEDLSVLTGKNLNVKKLNRDEIENLTILEEIWYPNGVKKYDKSRKFTFLEDVIDKFLMEETLLKFWISVKDKHYSSLFGKRSKTVDVLFELLSVKRVEHLLKYGRDISDDIVLSCTNPDITHKMIEYNNKHSMNFQISFDYFNVSSCIDSFIRSYYLSTMRLEKKYKLKYVLIEKENLTQEIIDRYKKNGIKVCVYGYWRPDEYKYKNIDYSILSY